MARVRGNRHQSKRSSTVVLVLSMLLMLTVVLLMLLGLGILGSDDVSSPVGDRIKLKRLKLDINKSEGVELGERGEQWSEILSWEPRAFLYHNFLSKEECEHLINVAKPHMVKSTVVDSKTGNSKDSRVRTSSGMFLRRGRDKVIANIEKRIADYTFIPAEHGEGLQVLHYEEGQKYEPHYDYFLDEFNTKNGDVEEGGETIFPAAKGNFSLTPGWNEMSVCAKGGLSVKPRMGDALLFWSMRPDATLDPSSLHGFEKNVVLSWRKHLTKECVVVALSSKGISGHPQSGCMLENIKSSNI
ncbi:putative prolyl 4-hydroxylase 3 [Orobanche gracilis]